MERAWVVGAGMCHPARTLGTEDFCPSAAGVPSQASPQMKTIVLPPRPGLLSEDSLHPTTDVCVALKAWTPCLSSGQPRKVTQVWNSPWDGWRPLLGPPSQLHFSLCPILPLFPPSLCTSIQTARWRTLVSGYPLGNPPCDSVSVSCYRHHPRHPHPEAS